MNQNQNKNEHIPVLTTEVMTYLKPQVGEAYLDATAGYGGHAAMVLAQTKPTAKDQAVLVDRDSEAVKALHERFSKLPVDIRQADFLSAARQLQQAGQRFDLILADLGVSSPHLDESGRGFAFQNTGPLDMRMDQHQALTAEQIVNTYSQTELVKLLKDFGEEPRAQRVAEAIVRNRPFHSTTELAEVLAKTLGRSGKIHPATKTFQALRIAVNDELSLLEQALPIWLDLLKPGGRIAVISFHSLEDRIVKTALQARAGDRYDADLSLLTKTPVTARPDELVHNPRARSAKLRAAAKTNISPNPP